MSEREMPPVVREPIIDPDLPIIDAHHHLWYHPHGAPGAGVTPQDDELGPLARNYSRYPRYLFDELLADTQSGHNVRATIYCGTSSMLKPDGPAHLRSVGEIEFANGMAAIAASGAFGDVRINAGIVGSVDLRRGAATAEVLEAHLRAGGDRYRGVRAAGIAYDMKLPRLTAVLDSWPDTMERPEFREGLALLAPLGLSCDIFIFEPQLAQMVSLANAFPETQIILNHVGMPIGIGAYAGTHAERFPHWREGMRAVAQCPNIALKVGGLGNAMCGFPAPAYPAAVTSEELAALWGPYIETSIELFGADRCMFESNFPVDGVAADYAVIWNAFKRISAGASAHEKAALFGGTAARIYRIDA